MMKVKFILCLILGVGTLFAQHSGGPPMSTPTTQPGVENPNNPLNGANPPNSTFTRVDDKKFAQEAAMGGLTEIQLAKLAEQRSSNDTVKQFAQTVLNEQNKANDQLQQVASRGNLTLPNSPDPKEEEALNKLSKLSGPAFDKAFAKDMVKEHEKQVNEFRAESTSGMVSQVREFAGQMLPELQQHLESAKNLEKTVKKESK